MTDREKLIELLETVPAHQRLYPDMFVDYLIENGVTVQNKWAVDILKAVACCSTAGLSCYDCPLFDESSYKCSPWTDDDMVEAVKILNCK